MTASTRLIVGALVVSLAACGGKSTPPGDAGVDTGVDASDPNGPQQVVVMTDLGGVTGVRDDLHGLRYFGGIPYAAPPTGANRWRPPQPRAPWTTPRPPSSPGACPQILPFGTSGFPTGSEDCLYLSVVVPYGATSNTPVVVWIHGGGFSINSGEQQDKATDGRELAVDQNVIVVTLNYRLGALGFLAHPALSAEQGGHSGNYGLLDQLAALRFIRRNIAAFGGDPTKITLYGQSAGGMSICALMASPLLSDTSVVPAAEQPLFSAAVLQSSPCDVPYPTLADAETQGQAFASAAAIGCTGAPDVLACLRNTTTVTTNEARDTLAMPNDFLRPQGANEASWGPNVDGYFMPVHPVDAIAAGNFLHVPVLAGYAEDEGNTSMHFRVIRSAIVGTNVVRATSTPTFDSNVNLLFEGGLMGTELATITALPRYSPTMGTYTDIAVDPQYVVNPQFHTTYEQAIAAIHGDMDLTCPARRAIRALAGQGVAVHGYFFTSKNPPFQLDPAFPLGAFHSGDVQFFFGQPAGGAILVHNFTAAEQALSDSMRDYLGNFVRTQDPNGGTLPTWDAYTTATPNQLTFGATIGTTSDARGTDCAIWDTLGRARIGTP